MGMSSVIQVIRKKIRARRLLWKYRKYTNGDLIKMLGESIFKIDMLIQCRKDELKEQREDE